eukprot:scaffold319119_cov13-Prasinocladus_malaysianus.AAC.1
MTKDHVDLLAQNKSAICDCSRPGFKAMPSFRILIAAVDGWTDPTLVQTVLIAMQSGYNTNLTVTLL